MVLKSRVARLGFQPIHTSEDDNIAADRNGSKWPITSILGVMGMASTEGYSDYLRYWEVRRPNKHSARSQAVAVLPIGARGGPPHHSATAKQ